MRRGKSVRCTLQHFQPAALQHFVGLLSRNRKGHDAIAVAVDDERGHRELLQVLAKVRSAERHNALLRRHGRCGPRDPLAERNEVGTDTFRPRFGVVEVGEELGQECEAVLLHARDHSVEHGLVDAVRIVGCLEQEGWHRSQEHGLGHTLGSVAREVPRNLTPTHGKACQYSVAQVEVRHHVVEVGREGVVVIAARGLARLAETAAIVGNTPISRFGERVHLGLPASKTERPAMNQHDGLALSHVLVVDICGVRAGGLHKWHGSLRAESGNDVVAFNA